MRLHAARHAAPALQGQGGMGGADAFLGDAHAAAEERQPRRRPARGIGAEELCAHAAIDLGASDTGESGSGEDGSSSESGDSLDGFIQDDDMAGGGQGDAGRGSQQRQQQDDEGEQSEEGSSEEDDPDGLKAWAWQTTGCVAPLSHGACMQVLLMQP